MPPRNLIPHSLQVGKYLVTPLVRPLQPAGFSAAVSIRSGRGSASHDRVLRLSAVCTTHREAHRRAMAEGFAWIDEAAQPVAAAPSHPIHF